MGVCENWYIDAPSRTVSFHISSIGCCEVYATGLYVVLVRQLVQCARIVKASAARDALAATDGASLAQKLGHRQALQTATWGNNKQRTCDVKHAAAVFKVGVGSGHWQLE